MREKSSKIGYMEYSTDNFLRIEIRYGLMQFTLVIFSTYNFFIESFKSSKSAQPFFTFKNSILSLNYLLLSLTINSVNSKKAPLKIHSLLRLVKLLFINVFKQFACYVRLFLSSKYLLLHKL